MAKPVSFANFCSSIFHNRLRQGIITGINHGQGFSANLATGLLVMAASLFGLPVSTTHVSVGALFGIGLTSRQADFRVIHNILLSWLVTLPCAAIIDGLVYWFMKN